MELMLAYHIYPHATILCVKETRNRTLSSPSPMIFSSALPFHATPYVVSYHPHNKTTLHVPNLRISIYLLSLSFIGTLLPNQHCSSPTSSTLPLTTSTRLSRRKHNVPRHLLIISAPPQSSPMQTHNPPLHLSTSPQFHGCSIFISTNGNDCDMVYTIHSKAACPRCLSTKLDELMENLKEYAEFMEGCVWEKRWD